MSTLDPTAMVAAWPFCRTAFGAWMEASWVFATVDCNGAGRMRVDYWREPLRFAEDGGVSHHRFDEWEIADGVLELRSASQSWPLVGLRMVGDVPCAFGHSEADGRMCVLWPQARLADSGLSWKCVVSSHAEYAEVTLPRLLRQLAPHVPPERTGVWIGGADERRTSRRHGVEVHEVEHASHTYTALIEAATVADCDYVLLVPDTCQPLRGFGKRLDDLEFGLHWDVLYAVRGDDGAPRSPVGFYRVGWLRQIADCLNEMKGLDRSRLDKVTRRPLPSKAGVWGFIDGAANAGDVSMGRKDVFGSGRARRGRRFSSIGLVKHSTVRDSHADVGMRL